MKLTVKGKGVSATIALAGAALAVVAAVGEIIYGAAYEQYADFVVVLCLLAGAVLLGVYAFIDHPVTDWSCLLGVIAIGFGMGLFLTNSFNVWADTWGIVGAFNFFNSQGGPIPAVALIVVSLLAAVCGIISCFTGKKEATK